MKFYISEPPRMAETEKEKLDELISWLTVLANTLNITFENIGLENFNREIAEKLKEVKK